MKKLSCHCGQVQIEINVENFEKLLRCNCSICKRKGSIMSLVKNDDFIGFMNTPILKATKGKSVKVFYNDGEYEEWKKTNETKRKQTRR